MLRWFAEPVVYPGKIVWNSAIPFVAAGVEYCEQAGIFREAEDLTSLSRASEECRAIFPDSVGWKYSFESRLKTRWEILRPQSSTIA
jgi:hypothetical protein